MHCTWTAQWEPALQFYAQRVDELDEELHGQGRALSHPFITAPVRDGALGCTVLRTSFVRKNQRSIVSSEWNGHRGTCPQPSGTGAAGPAPHGALRAAIRRRARAGGGKGWRGVVQDAWPDGQRGGTSGANRLDVRSRRPGEILRWLTAFSVLRGVVRAWRTRSPPPRRKRSARCRGGKPWRRSTLRGLSCRGVRIADWGLRDMNAESAGERGHGRPEIPSRRIGEAAVVQLYADGLDTCS